MTTVTLMANIAALGNHVLLVRTIAPLLIKGRFGEAGDRFRAVRRLVLSMGVGFAVATALLAFPLAYGVLDDGAIAPFTLALVPAVVLLPQMRVHNAFLRCLGRVKLSQSLEGICYTSLAAIGVIAVWLVWDDLDPLIVPGMLILGLAISVGVGYGFARSHLREWPRTSRRHRPDLAAGARIAAGPLINQSGNWVILLLVTALLSAADAGVLRVAVLTCMLMQLINSSFATMAGPHLARAAEAQDHAQIRRTIAIAGGIGLVIAAPVGLVALLAPEWVMGLFGEEFAAGALALQLLVIGQLVNVLAGPVGAALIMQKRERLVLVGELCATGIALAIAAVLLPGWGLAGAAAGMLAADLIRNAANSFFIWTRSD